ncbi:hypothetical protein [Rubinisphaera brasiliensis]|uniref:Secreted protein n=1 Tax=Rubinisphaera brasiliensis (strain ATCC 49424 / DSM 5305 / JCM 21570 / IAM 15109 / NBRC 103401 / IFAM 1448) TaxID=756272 RepID=F0SRL8_RUBBR|nr:hypothetical protein [Rubinisphaera brasiliensis]ADY59141.1 hypothetical protein Plabr_1530 [Rubinisphaera brasiliensis DSM 5305]
MSWKPWSVMLSAIAMMAMVGCDAEFNMQEGGSMLVPAEDAVGTNDEEMERNETVPGAVPDLVPEGEPAADRESEVVPDGQTPPNAVEGADGTPVENTN